MHCAHILYLPTGKCILHIQPSMYTIIHTQTTSVGTDLICWTWTVSINITSLKFNQGHFLTSLLLPQKRTKRSPDSRTHPPSQDLSSFSILPSTVFSTGYVKKTKTDTVALHILPSGVFRSLNPCQPVLIFYVPCMQFYTKMLSWTFDSAGK